MDELITYLEPQEKPKRGPAIIMPLEGWIKYKTALEKLCAILESYCTPEFKSNLAKVSGNIDALVEKVKAKKPKVN